MIIKEPNYDEEIAKLSALLETPKVKNDKELYKKIRNIRSGLYCEKQMAYVLRIQFESDKDILVFNDLKLEIDGRTAQIDHVVLTCYSAYFIESKSVNGKVTVNEFGEWSRNWYDARSKRYFNNPMNSPLEQSKRHEIVWRDVMRGNAEKFMGKLLLGIQKGMGSYNYEHFIAISEKGEIGGKGRVALADSLCKYDQVSGKIAEHHKANAKGMLGTFMSKSDETFKTLNESELEKLGEFLLSNDKATNDVIESFKLPQVEAVNGNEQTSQELIDSIPEEDLKWAGVQQEASTQSDKVEELQQPVLESSEKSQCPHCSGQMSIQYGKYGYYWKCSACNKNVAIKESCPACSTKMRIRKDKQQFFITCKSCKQEELYHQA